MSYVPVGAPPTSHPTYKLPYRTCLASVAAVCLLATATMIGMLLGRNQAMKIVNQDVTVDSPEGFGVGFGAPLLAPYTTSYFRTAIEEQVHFCERIFPFLRDEVLKPNSTVNLKVFSAGGKKSGLGLNVFPMFLHKLHDPISTALRTHKTWDKPLTYNILHQLELHQALKNLQPNQVTLFDIGANVGWFTFIVAKFGYRAVAVEPSPTNELAMRMTLCMNPELMGRVTIIGKGLSDKEQTCPLVSTFQAIGNTKVACTDAMYGNPIDKQPLQDAPQIEGENQRRGPKKKPTRPSGFTFKHHGIAHLIRLDDLVAEFLGGYGTKDDIAIFKIDAEGHEPRIVEGGVKSLLEGGSAKLVSEYSPTALGSVEALGYIRKFIDAGYRIKIGVKGWLEEKEYSVAEELVQVVDKEVVNIYMERPDGTIDVMTDAAAAEQVKADENALGVSDSVGTLKEEEAQLKENQHAEFVEVGEVVEKPAEVVSDDLIQVVSEGATTEAPVEGESSMSIQIVPPEDKDKPDLPPPAPEATSEDDSALHAAHKGRPKKPTPPPPTPVEEKVENLLDDDF